MKKNIPQLGDQVKLDGLDVSAKKLGNNSEVVIAEMVKVVGDLVNGVKNIKVDYFGDELGWEELGLIRNEDVKEFAEITDGTLRVHSGIYFCGLYYLPLRMAKKLAEYGFQSIEFDNLQNLNMDVLKELANGVESISFPESIVLDAEMTKDLNEKWGWRWGRHKDIK